MSDTRYHQADDRYTLRPGRATIPGTAVARTLAHERPGTLGFPANIRTSVRPLGAYLFSAAFGRHRSIVRLPTRPLRTIRRGSLFARQIRAKKSPWPARFHPRCDGRRLND